MRLIQTFVVKEHTFIEETLEIHQSIRPFLFAKGLKMEKRVYFERCTGAYFEFGFSKKTYRNDPPNTFGFKL